MDEGWCSCHREGFYAGVLTEEGSSVEIVCYRLRAKLNLSHEMNLTEFLIKESEAQEN